MLQPMIREQFCFQWPAGPLRPSQNAMNFGGRTLGPACRLRPAGIFPGIRGSLSVAEGGACTRNDTLSDLAAMLRGAAWPV
jgi:hypothetical protein